MSKGKILNNEEKRTVYQDGFIIVRGAVEQTLVERARARIKSAEKGQDLGPTSEMTDLVNASEVTAILNDVMGEFDPPSRCQIGVLKKTEPGDFFNNLGYRDKDQPYYGAQVHMDGLLTIRVPQEVQEGTEKEIYDRYIASGPKGDLGRSPDVMGHNMVPLFQDPEMTLGMGSFTAFVFVCLNDQMTPGSGQTMLLKGAHHATEKFLNWQREQGDKLGPEGPGWPRINPGSPNRCGLIYLPESVREQFIDINSLSTPDGVRWPEPTQVLMEPGDACIAVFHLPHSGSRNENGTESRKNIIFRIRNKSRQPSHVATGLSDHPDRGQMGEWLEYEAGNNPWQRSKEALCNQWAEWQGMQEIVSEMRRG